VVAHSGRAKRLAVSPDCHGLVWSAGEDGLVRQWDRRERWTEDAANLLVDLGNLTGRPAAEAKCLAVCPSRSELLAVGANDPYVRVFDRRKLSLVARGGEPWGGGGGRAGDAAAAYFVPGHLPQMEAGYSRRMRPLSSTFLAYNQAGTELVVNLGGEQVYLYDRWALYSTAPPVELTVMQDCDRRDPGPLAPAVQAVKAEANREFEAGEWSRAVALYNRCVTLQAGPAPHPVLAGNRAAALLKRGWDGDSYAAARDCLAALSQDPGHVKAELRLVRCLLQLDRLQEAETALVQFRRRHPELGQASACSSLEIDLAEAKSKPDPTDPPSVSGPAPVLSRYTAASFLRQVEPMEEDSDSSSEEETAGPRPPPPPRLSGQEVRLRRNARDYTTRYLGACNTTTDIKEANFLGQDGQFIMAGSDDGKFFIWDRETTNLARVLRGDETIVNCLQPHPVSPLLASSGIDPVVRLWEPGPQDGRENFRAVADCEAVATSNQRRMNADPFETILLNMGYRMNTEDEEDEGGERAVQCRAS